MIRLVKRVDAPPTECGVKNRMLKRFVFLWVVLFVFSGTAGSAREPASLAAELDRLVASRPLAKASVGIYVERASDGSPVYARGADRQLIPASNQKILTSLAALHRFGPTHRFKTRIWAPKAPDPDGLVDTLIVEGRGDPVMNSEDWWRLAADLRRQGLRGIRGDLRVDDSYFDRPGWHPSWGRVSARAYHAPIGALTANYGSFFVTIRPRKTVGSAASVSLDPPVDYLRVRNRAKTAPPDAQPQLRVGRVQGTTGNGTAEEIVQVEGVARQGDEADGMPRSVLDPGLYAGSLLALQLKANGIFLDGEVRRVPGGGERSALILERPGRSLAEIVQLCMKYSNNSIAESLVKSLGAYRGADLNGPPARQGNWADGIRALREELGKLGIDLGNATIVDGSGLSLQNRITPRTFVGALRVGLDSFQLGPEFVASMPIAQRDGTLEKRLSGGGGRIRAKTGLLGDAAVTTLSGYVERADGETLIFSILVNGYSGSSSVAMDAVDRLARTLLEAPLPERKTASRRESGPL
jgi:D-alanyl-D-alanine carboxypeptidase/D-alanyl-D-alanine-endopeptidase (penicillin-binding protein 4)